MDEHRSFRFVVDGRYERPDEESCPPVCSTEKQPDRIAEQVGNVSNGEREAIASAIVSVRVPNGDGDDRQSDEQGVSDHSPARDDAEPPRERFIDEIGELRSDRQPENGCSAGSAAATDSFDE
jgi:hypothetical protein